jgi:hypothetical protein
LSSSNLALVRVSEKSFPPRRLDSNRVDCLEESVRLAFPTLAHSPEIAANVGSGLLVQFDEVIDHTIVKVFSTEMGITSGRQDSKGTIINQNVKRSSSDIVDDNLRFIILLVETVGIAAAVGSLTMLRPASDGIIAEISSGVCVLNVSRRGIRQSNECVVSHYCWCWQTVWFEAKMHFRLDRFDPGHSTCPPPQLRAPVIELEPFQPIVTVCSPYRIPMWPTG